MSEIQPANAHETDPNTLPQWRAQSSGSSVMKPNETMVMGAVPRYHAFTVPVGQDLLLILREFCRKYHIYSAFVVSCIGAISHCTYRCSLGKRSGAGKEIRKLNGFYQLCNVQGTLSATYFRLCGTFGDSNGESVGGQLLDNVIVASPCEVVICELPGIAFSRTVTNPVTAPEGQLHLHCTSENQVDMKELVHQASTLQQPRPSGAEES
mmetsp:Transcript_19354/g.30262  ORF Transcript_19354/g.30262 Transcript_19354/m.30262 type:complete len:209 (+) Transcript_19354:31-657(+)